MPDFTYRKGYVCQQYFTYCLMRSLNPQAPQSDCHWNQESDGGEVVYIDGEPRCPECGHEAIIVDIAE